MDSNMDESDGPEDEIGSRTNPDTPMQNENDASEDENSSDSAKDEGNGSGEDSESLDDDTDDSNEEESDSSEESDSENHEDVDSGSEANDEDDGGAAAAASETVHMTADGREMSAYEKLRQDRIRRNREKLAQLGLQGKEGGGVLGEKKSSGRPAGSRKRPKEKVKMRNSLSRHTKAKPMNYAEPPSSVAALLRKQAVDTKESKKRPPKKKGRDANDRMEKFIHFELKRLQGYKTTVRKRGLRFVKHATKELAYWTRKNTGKTAQLSEQKIATKLRHEEERQHLGMTSKELLQVVDARMPELLDAAAKYDEKYEAAEKRHERRVRELEDEFKMSLLDGLDRYPKAIRETTSLLNAALLERAPKDAPAPRRSRRSTEEEEESPKKKGRPAKKTEASADQDRSGKRKRLARNVGGWVSPQFAEEIDRSWLDRDSVDESFDIRSYVPQVGDVVLYYPAGHRAFMQKHSDWLGRKTKSVTRLPLWERAAMEGEREERTKSTKKRNSSMWYTEEWLEGVSGELGKYPILCRVHTANAEFPNDYFVKTVKDGVVSWKMPKQNARNPRDESSSRLRLFLMLRPLTAVVPPAWESSRVEEARDSRFKDDQPLSPAPLFGVVTFPCELSPFVVPFAWTYHRYHAMATDQQVMYKSETTAIQSFEGISTSSFRIDDKIAAFQSTLSNCTKTIDCKRVLLERKTNVTKILPLPEIRAVLDAFDVVDKNASDGSTSADPADFTSLIRSTFPLWGSVVVSLQGDLVNACPWELQMPDECVEEDRYIPEFLAEPYGLDEPLRARIGSMFEKAVKDEPVAATFQTCVTEDEAPSYTCAVPLSMSFDKIQRRLQPDEKRRICYYTSVDAVLADVSTIFENCLLYNSPESSVVEIAGAIVNKLKDEIAGKSKDHIKEIDIEKRATEDRKLRMMQILDSDTSNDELLKDLFVMNSLRNPHRSECDNSWLEQPSGSSTTTWVPQAGDRVQYSPQLHARFVENHEDCFEPHHCLIHHFDDEKRSETGESEETTQWRGGRVVWTRCCFPKQSPKKKRLTGVFPSQTTILVLGIKFDDDHKELAKLRVVCWRPCAFPGDNLSGETCASCSVPFSSSFLRADDETDPSEALASQDAADIASVLSLFKKRCIKSIPVDHVDDRMTKSSLNSGYLPALETITEKNAPSFGETFGLEINQKDEALSPAVSPRKGTRGKKVSVRSKTGAADSAVKKLLRVGFLPPFASGHGGSGDDAVLNRQRCLSPWPKMSLEFVLLRLSTGFYRHRSAVENDIIEAYASVASLFLSEAVARKREPVSMKKLCRTLASEKNRLDGQQKLPSASAETKIKNISDEERILMAKIRPVRELYSAALVAAAETKVTLKLFGLVGPSVPEEVLDTKNDERETEMQADARCRLRLLLDAVGRDQLSNIFPGISQNAPIPPREVRIISQGKPISKQKRVVVDNVTTAIIDENEVRVKVRCDKQLVTYERELPQVDTLEASRNGQATSVKVVCDDDTVVVDMPRGRRSKSKKEKLITVNSLSFGQDDFDQNELLTRFFFGRINRRNPCARCEAYRRSMLVCRVRRSHSNFDFDWIETFKGMRGLDGILKLMQGEALPEEEEVALQTNLKEIEEEKGEETKSDVLVVPKEMTQKAERALHLAKAVADRAEIYADAPIRFSKNFVKEAFPIDPTDGHCVYCVICGLSGDLLCCDGCSNVVHGACVGIDKFPDGDWFCEECELKKSSDVPGDQEQPFGRVEYESEGETELVALLDELRSARPELPKRIRVRTKTPKPVSKNENKHIATKPPPDSSGPFAFLAQMAQEFLADSEIAHPDDLLELRTQEVAKMFAKWRRKVGLAKLNGGGETAYVSSWKSTCRKNATSKETDENVTYLSDDEEDDEEPAESDDGDFGETKKRRRRARRQKGPKQHRSRRKRVDVSSLSDPLEALSEVNRNFLKSIGIVTGYDFLTTKTTELGASLIKWRKKEGLPPLKGSGDIATMSAAKTLCRKYAVEMGREDLAKAEPADRRTPQRKGLKGAESGTSKRRGRSSVSEIRIRGNTSNAKPPKSPPRRSRSVPVKVEQEAESTPRRPGKRASRSPNRYGTDGGDANKKKPAAEFSAVEQVNEMLDEKPARKRRRKR